RGHAADHRAHRKVRGPVDYLGPDRRWEGVSLQGGQVGWVKPARRLCAGPAPTHHGDLSPRRWVGAVLRQASAPLDPPYQHLPRRTCPVSRPDTLEVDPLSSLGLRMSVADPTVIEFDVRTDEMLVNMGPQHPSTHGVLRLVLRTDGEVISEVTPHLGYLHR